VVDTYKTGIKNTWEIHYNQDGLDIYNKMTATKMGDDVVVHFTDFTKLKNLQLELLQKIEQLQQSNQNLEEFAYAASHDMKEPIRKIHFFGDRLRESLKDRITVEEESFFNRMESATIRMRTLIEDLLQYSQVSIKPRVRDDLNLNQLIGVVLEDLDLEIDQKHAEITLDTLPTVRGHERQLQQAFQNLLANSLKYCKPDVRPSIRISHKKVLGRDTHLDLAMSDHHRAFHCLSISDNGIGFAQNNAERIFNVFTRLHGNHEYRGTGVGLSIVRKVIENHGGHIWATSAPGKGSTFKVILPVS
jgi:light-regulated signal transduction histidine kinase (bacteriophytochrome)